MTDIILFAVVIYLLGFVLGVVVAVLGLDKKEKNTDNSNYLLCLVSKALKFAIKEILYQKCSICPAKKYCSYQEREKNTKPYYTKCIIRLRQYFIFKAAKKLDEDKKKIKK
jgi:cbb3-type cytochrome oxidase subunit 3